MKYLRCFCSAWLAACFLIPGSAIDMARGEQISIRYRYDGAGRLASATSGDLKTVEMIYDPAGNLLRRVFIPETQDDDADGQSDNWERFHFGDLSRDGLGDADGDGMSDAREFLAGVDPNDPTSRLALNANPASNPSGTTITFQSVSGKTYRLQYKQTLADVNWIEIPDGVTATSGESSILDATAGAADARFYRIVVVLP